MRQEPLGPPALSPPRIAAAASAATALVLFLLVAWDVGAGLTWSWDAGALLALAELRTPLGDWVGVAIAYAGNPAVAIALALVVAWRVRRRWPASARALVVVCAVDLVASLGVKALVERPRPALVPHVERVGGYSFPSGHALASVAVFAVVLAFVAVHRARAWPWVLAAVLLAVVVGLSRVYVGVHWPSDVVAGWALGATILAWAVAEMTDERGR